MREQRAKTSQQTRGFAENALRRRLTVHRRDYDVILGNDRRQQPPKTQSLVLLIEYIQVIDDIVEAAPVRCIFELIIRHTLYGDFRHDAQSAETDTRGAEVRRVLLCDRTNVTRSRDQAHSDEL